MEEENKTVDKKEYLDKELQFVKSMLDNRNYALMNGVSSVGSEIYRSRRSNRNAIKRAVEDPFKQYETLQDTSMVAKATNGIYRRTLNYISRLFTYDHIIYPLNVDKIKTPDKMQKLYSEMCVFLERYNVKFNAPWITERMLEQGELYFIQLETANGMLLQEIPSKFCRITSIGENYVCSFAISLKKLTDKNVVSMPSEIQQAYKKFKSGSLKPEKLIDGEYYEIKKGGYAFNLERFLSKGIPYFSAMFDDLLELEDMKDLKSDNAIIESIKLIHQKYPVNKDTGESLVDYESLDMMHRATKGVLPKGTGITTNPLDVNSLSLASNDSKIRNNVAEALESTYDTSGINMELFNGKKNSNEAVASGKIVDSFIAMVCLDMIQSWVNNELMNNKKSGVIWQFKFIHTTNFNKDVYAKNCRENMAFGGSRLEFLASNGYTPAQGMSVLKMESMLGLDKILIPQQTSHTLGSDSESGSPTKAESDNNDGLSNQPENE